jgi:hypothetical protein
MSLESAVAVANPVATLPALLAKKAKDNIDDSADARAAQQRLEEQRRAQLATEAADRAAAKKRAETAAQRVGLGSARTQLVGTFGAGSGDTPFGSGPGNLFGN